MASFLFRNQGAGVGKLGWNFENEGEGAHIRRLAHDILAQPKLGGLHIES